MFFLDSEWEIEVKEKAVPENSKAIDVEVIFLCTTGSLSQSSVSVNFDFSNWSTNNYVLIRFSKRRMKIFII